MQLEFDNRRQLSDPNMEQVCGEPDAQQITPVKLNGQLLKWIGNKQRFAVDIAKFFPETIGDYYEPFLGSGAVLATLSPRKAFGSDIFSPLMDIWSTLKDNPDQLIEWYSERRNLVDMIGKKEAYGELLASYNSNPNGADFLFLARSCYGGVIRFRKSDGYMSTPCGPHTPISAASFAKRTWEWNARVQGTEFESCSFEQMMDRAKDGDLIYCDPPYVDSQAILYGAQRFSLRSLFEKIQECKNRGVRVVLSIDGTKKSGKKICDVEIPDDLFEAEASISVGRSMLRRLQLEGKTLEDEVVSDRLLLTYAPKTD